MKKREKKKGKKRGERRRRREGGVEETAEENLFCISMNLRPGRTRPCRSTSSSFFLLLPLLPPRPFPSKEGRSFNPRTVVYDIDEKSMPSLFPSLFSESANRRPPCNFIPPSLICFYSEEREGKREIYIHIYEGLTTFLPISYRRIYCQHRSVHCNEDCL